MELEQLDQLWEATQRIFPILNENLTDVDLHTNSDFKMVISELSRLELAENIYETLYYDIKTVLMNQTVPEFWNYFKYVKDEEDNPCAGFDKFQIAINWLWREYSKYQVLLGRIKIFKNMCEFNELDNKSRNDDDYFGLLFRAALLSQLPVLFNKIVDQFYGIVMKVLVNMHTDLGSDGGIEGAAFKCEGCERDRDDCRCNKLLTAFEMTNSYLHDMMLFERIAETSVLNLVQKKITCYVKDTCQGSSDSSHFERLEFWLQNNVFKWLKKFFGDNTDDPDQQEKINCMHQKLNHHLFETYAHAIIDQFFNIIIEYPDSKPSIDDLKICLVKIDLRNHLTTTVKKSLETRLLHPGVDTGDVLTGYVAAIKALKHLDSSGVLLESITEPVKEYLKIRNDTVRCVITALTEEGPTDLAEELAKSEATKDETKSVKDDMTNWETWMPDPVDANTKKSSSTVRSADIISMVVDIYGSKELFVNEYRNLLAERLLSNLDFNIEKEIRNLELLKLRFGETLLHSCEVMLKDISDSKRINAHIQSDTEYTSAQIFDMSTLIVSSQFWPSFKKETIELAPAIQEQFDRFSKSYEAYKGNRTLNWNTLNGKVNIEIDFADKIINLVVSTTQATIIMHFQNQAQWNLEELSLTMKIPPSILRKKINFWQSQGLIKETGDDIFTLSDENMDDTMDDINNSHDICEDDEGDSPMASASDQKEEEFQVFWSYIVGMLINLDSLPLERIYQMLKMFAAQEPGMEFSQQELKNFLQRKVKEQKLVFAAGVYYLPK